MRYLLAALAAAVILTLGTGLVVEGQLEFWLPWHAVARLPVLDNVLPARLALYASLAAALIVALWTGSAARRRSTGCSRCSRSPRSSPTSAQA